MDRSVLEEIRHRVWRVYGHPAYAVGANKGYAYIRVNIHSPLNVLELAIKQAKKMGLLGQIF